MKKIATALLLIALSFGALVQIQAQQVAVDRSLDLAWSQLPGYGFISLPSMRFGKGTASTFQITVYYRGGGNGCIMRFGTSQSGNVANYVGITINTGFLAIQVGDKTVQSTATVPTNAWKDISVVVENKLNGANLQGYVTAYIADVEIALNGRWVNPIPDATREQSFVGHCENGQRFNGLVDNLRIWGKALTATEIKQNSAAGFDDLIKTGLVAHFPMNEGKGIYTGGVSGSDADDFFSALLSGNFAWGAKAQTGVTQCGSSGDPHLSPWIGNYYDPPHVPGYFLMVQCIDQGESQFEIRTYHSQGCCWGKATVTEAVTIKHFNTIFLVARGAVYQKRTIPVETFVTVNPVDQTLESGMKVFFGKSGSYPWVNVYGPPYGFIKITDYINYFVMTTGVTEDCKGRSGLCSSQVYFLNSWQFKFDDVTIPEVAITNPPPPNQNPCDNALPEVAAAAKAACDALFGADDTYLDEKINCLFDVCSSGDLTSVGDRSSHEACLIAEQRAAAAGEVYIPTVDCEPKCPGMCSGLGTCDQQTGKCTCNSGWAGPDCRQKASIHYFTVESSYYNKGVLLSRELSGPDFPTQSYTIDNLIMASKFNVPASALFYVAQVTNTITNTVDSHLYIINNANTDRGTAAYNLKATYDSGFVGTPVVHKFEASTAGTQIVADPTNIDFSWSDGVTGGAIIKNLPNQPWCVTFQVTSDSLEQVLLGSGQRVLQTLDISKLPKADWASFKICGEELENPCADIDNCADCAANPQCGWCREKQACFLGNQAGPTDGSMCKNWRFSFDSNISRRIQASFGWPMNPDHSEVFLVENPVGKPFAKLPLDLTVDMGKEDNSVWDVLLVVPNAKSTNELDKVAITAQSATIVSYLTQFPDLALAIGSYSVAPNQFKLEIPLKNADNDHVFFEIALSGIILDAAAPGGANDQRSVLEALKAAATTSNPGFRQFARRMVFIVVDRPYSTATTSIASVKAALLSQNIIPVFAATSAVKQTYQALVAQLGFGSVVDHTAGSQHFVKELNLGFKKAGGAIALVVDDSNVGYVDTANYNTDIMNIQGLTQKMRGKFLFPMIADANEALSEKTSKLIAPGFGFATVHNVLSDLPVATGVNVIAIEDQTLSPFDDTEPGIYVSLTGHAFDNDGEVIPRITVLPVLGKLFQVNDQHLKGPEITQVDTLVTDPLFRVIYEPVQYGNSVGNAPYATLTYVVQDACTDSKPKEIGIVITAINHAPFANAFGQIAFEDTDLTFELKGFDIEGHPLKAIVVKAPFEIDTNGVEVASGQLFQYNNGQRGDEIVFGVETEVTDENRRVIFAPKPDHNSEGRPITRFTKPTMTFKVKESSHFPEDDPNWPMLESTEQSFQIFVTAVNDRPTVNIPGLDEAQLAADGICFSGTCTVLEDLGAPLGQTANPKLIFVGGSDPEGDVLKVVVTAVSCKHEPTLALVGQSAQIAVNTETTGLASGVHEPRFQFRPLQDTFDATSYCTFTYKVNDGELDSLDTRTVVIAVTPVNDQPRPVDGQAGSLAVGEGETQTFTLSGFDPENQPFNLVLFSCNPAVVSYPKGTLVYDGQTINCDDVSPASPLTLSPVVGAPSGVFEFSFTAPVFQSGDSNVLIYAFSDGSIPNNQLVQSMFQLVILDVNQPPLFFTPLAPAETFQQKIFDITVEVGQELTFNLHVAQNDATNGRVDFRAQITQFAATGDLFITWPLNPDNPPFDISVGPTIIADPINMVPPFDIIRTPGDVKAVTNGQNKFSFSAPFAMMNTFLPSLRFKGIAPSPAGQTHRVECIVEDNGNSGSGGNKRAQVTFNIKVVAPGSNNSLAGAAAAAGLVAAGIAAVAGWRKLRRRDDNGFQPWTMDAEEDFVTNNPLFEAPRESMNQIYEAPSTVNKQ